ncbi:MAG TPA: alpha/beta hydrolase domain-containing protein [Bryobacteraceae bacterium]|nr:alpha/beta hydrolase domain-containing protein [Bryobacteraceae bacterium]
MAVTQLQITSRTSYDGGRSFGEVGAYELLQGRMYFEVSPDDPHNKVIADISLAPRNAQSRVELSADFALLKPVAALPAARLICDVVNRGNKTVMRLNLAGPAQPSDAEPRAGDGFLMRRGYSIAWCGWQPDAPDTQGLMRAYLPEAVQNGARLSGQTSLQFQPSKLVHVQLLSDAGHRPQPVASLDDPAAMLTVRDYHDGPSRLVPRSEWQFAREDAAGAPVADPNFVYCAKGFEPGKVYELTYTTIGAPVMGLGLAAMRDCGSWLRYAPASDGNPLAGTITSAYGFGVSLSGRFLREFVYQGMNQDERGRNVFDGLLTVVGSSRRGEFNFRFAQPSTNIARAPGNVFPFAYVPQTDPVTGKTGNLLERARAQGSVPKILAVNSGMEYWWSGASLQHADLTGSDDVDIPDQVRCYFVCGAQHASGGLPLADKMPDGLRTQHLLNTIDYTPVLRAALTNLDRWVREGADPPRSRVPSVREGTATRRETLAPAFGSIPGAHFPKHLPRKERLDFGPDVANGTVRYPPTEGGDYGVLVSTLDADCNEIGGVRTPDLRVPLATYMGWNVRHADAGGAGEYVSSALPGSTLPFARTRAVREQRNDARSSLEERYASKEDFLDRVRTAAAQMVEEGHLLEEDIPLVERQAGERWDAFQAL